METKEKFRKKEKRKKKTRGKEEAKDYLERIQRKATSNRD